MKLEKLECQPDSQVKSSLLSKIRSKLSAVEMKLAQLEGDLTGVEQGAEEKNRGRLECSVAYPGTEVTFGEKTLRLRQIARQCIVKLVEDEIVLM